jgi:hypothetical protein
MLATTLTRKASAIVTKPLDFAALPHLETDIQAGHGIDTDALIVLKITDFPIRWDTIWIACFDDESHVFSS